jgi:signal transduction histidine kinase
MIPPRRAHVQSAIMLKLQQQMTDLQSALQCTEQQAQARTRFLANMSHEIRTPLRIHSVVGFSELSEFSALAPATSTEDH